MRIIVRLWLVCLMAVASQQGSTARHAAKNPIVVKVVDSSNHRSIKEARVFVLSTEGRELASAITKDYGIATLTSIDEDQHPKYLIVEHPNYFLSGLRWLDGMEEYYILVTTLTVR